MKGGKAMLWKKMLRDIWNNKVQFISIIIMAALSTYIYVGMAGVWNGLEYARDEYYNKTNYADYIISSNDGFTSENISSLRTNKDIEYIDSRYTLYNCITPYEGNANLTMHIIDNNQVSKSVVIQGQKFDSEVDGIWLDYRFAEEHKLKVGDNLRMQIGKIVFS